MRSRTLLLLILVALLIVTLFGYVTIKPIFDERENLAQEAKNAAAATATPQQETPIATFINPLRGEKTATITIVEFGDYLCSFCATIGGTLDRVLEEYKGRVKLVWKDFPLTNIHPLSGKLALAGRCAQEQGKFWEFHAAAFAAQENLINEVELLRLTSGLGFSNDFTKCYQDRSMEARVQSDFEEGQRLGIDGVPYFFIGKIRLSGAVSYERFKEAIEQELQ